MADENVTATSPPDDVYGQAPTGWLIPVYLVVSIIGIVGNSLVIVIISSVRKMRSTTTNLLILHQSVIDLTSAVLMASVVLSEVAASADYVMSLSACMFWFSRYPVWSCFMVSTINLMALTLERHHAIVRPLRHSTVYSPARVTRFFAVFWVAGFVLLSNLIFMSDVLYDKYCLFARFESEVVQHAVGVVTVVLFYLIPLTVMVFTYSSILREVRRTSPERNRGEGARGVQPGTQERLEKNILKVLALVVMVYVVCWSPNQILYLYYSLGGHLDFAGAFYHLTVVLVTCNMSVNPFVYALKYHQFREGLVAVFCGKGRKTLVCADSESNVVQNKTELVSENREMDVVQGPV
ncbi:neuropeptides capa receptor-like [Patiria miniata]|uniref:G-protein coupled receptors family 1 profile domain-containing protein n=1 Tax=Patiria miniata TaxID=46514 RepID=A0A914AB81_PATMI|nr:neuropeptides capa receptor-like [Patiria miniata]